MSDLVMWNLIVGFLVPNLIAVLQQPRFSEGARAAITAVVSIVGGLGTAYFNGQWNPADVVGSILVVGVAAITFYKGFWRPTGVAPAIENATAPKHRNERGQYDPIHLLVVIILVLVVVALLFWLF